MKKLLVIFVAAAVLYGCYPNYDTLKLYDYIIVNQLDTSVVEIIPTSHSDLWITQQNSFIIAPGEKSIICSYSKYSDDSKAKDIYDSCETIVLFDLYIDNVKSDEELYGRCFWDFNIGPVDDKGTYTLTIDEDILNNQK